MLGENFPLELNNIVLDYLRDDIPAMLNLMMKNKVFYQLVPTYCANLHINNNLPFLLKDRPVESYDQWQKVMKAQQKEITYFKSKITELRKYKNTEDLINKIEALDKMTQSIPYGIENFKKAEREIVELNTAILKITANMPKQDTLKISCITRLTADGLNWLKTNRNLSRIKNLYLSENYLSELPMSLSGHFENIQTITLTKNNFSTFPNSILKCKKLQNLKISENNIDVLPNGIYELQSLVLLDVSNNRISELPDSLSQIKSIRTIALDYNLFQTLPEVLKKIKQLNYLGVLGNYLPQLPLQNDINFLTKMQLIDSEGKLSEHQASGIPNRSVAAKRSVN